MPSAKGDGLKFRACWYSPRDVVNTTGKRCRWQTSTLSLSQEKKSSDLDKSSLAYVCIHNSSSILPDHTHHSLYQPFRDLASRRKSNLITKLNGTQKLEQKPQKTNHPSFSSPINLTLTNVLSSSEQSSKQEAASGEMYCKACLLCSGVHSIEVIKPIKCRHETSVRLM